MTGTLLIEHAPAVVEAGERGETVELVRGSETRILDWLQPVVREESVLLDLHAVERIDAAGVAALISLYCDASKTGHSFAVFRPRRHVREILKLLGLDRILLAREEAPAERKSPLFDSRFERTAA